MVRRKIISGIFSRKALVKLLLRLIPVVADNLGLYIWSRDGTMIKGASDISDAPFIIVICVLLFVFDGFNNLSFEFFAEFGVVFHQLFDSITSLSELLSVVAEP